MRSVAELLSLPAFYVACSCTSSRLYFAALIDKCTLLTLHLAQTRTALALYDDLPLSLLAL